MEERISREVRKKGYLLFRKSKVKKELETEKRIHFKVEGETEIHSVIFDKIKKKFFCDCSYFSLHEKKCSHIIACELFLKQA
ncbi:MAG: hypothetical protein QW403_03270 [Candidatus Aenigmatarchaeota archaeon]